MKLVESFVGSDCCSGTCAVLEFGNCCTLKTLPWLRVGSNIFRLEVHGGMLRGWGEMAVKGLLSGLASTCKHLEVKMLWHLYPDLITDVCVCAETSRCCVTAGRSWRTCWRCGLLTGRDAICCCCYWWSVSLGNYTHTLVTKKATGPHCLQSLMSSQQTELMKLRLVW